MCLWDIPMNVPTTAAATDNDDGDWCLHCHHTLIINDDTNPTLTFIDPQEWDNFYNEFLQFTNLFNTVTPQQNNDNNNPVATTPEVIDNDEQPLPDNNTIYIREQHTASSVHF